VSFVGKPQGPLKTPLASLSPPRRRWLRSDLSATEFSVAGLAPCPRRSRLERCSRNCSECCGPRCCVPKGQEQISPGQSVAPPRVVVAHGARSPEGATQTDASIVSPLQGFLPVLIRYPGRRRRSHNSRRLALGWYVRPLQGRGHANAKIVRLLAPNRVVTTMAGPVPIPGRGTRKKCLPPPRPRGRMTLRRLADGRPAAQPPQPTAHEQNDATEPLLRPAAWMPVPVAAG
jgi:hypothetical protein